MPVTMAAIRRDKGSGEQPHWVPAMRKWHTGARPDEFRRIAPATRIYRTDGEVEPPPSVRSADTSPARGEEGAAPNSPATRCT